MKNTLINILILFIAIPLGLAVFYFGPLSNRILENIDIPGKITQDQADEVVQNAGYYPLYSWYQVIDFAPYVIVMSENESATKEGKIYVGAFDGVIDKNEIDKDYVPNEKPNDSQSTNTNIEEYKNFLDDPLINETINKFVYSKYKNIVITNKNTEENWGKNLINIEMWADDVFVIFNFDEKTGEINELKEQHWKTYDESINNTEEIEDKDPPVITILYPKRGQVFESDVTSIDVSVDVYDEQDPNPTIEGQGPYTLEQGFNTIYVFATDQSGNVASSYVLVERK